MTSFPKRSLFYKLIGTFIVLAIFASLAIIATKKCHIAAASEADSQDLKTNEDIEKFISNYFVKLHILHALALICGSVIIIFGFIDLVPKYDEDLKFAFHFISVFVIAIIGIFTLYCSYVAYEKPCTTTTNSTCCSIIIAPKLFANDRPMVSAISQNDSSMIAVTILDAIAGLLLLITAIMYFIDTRSEAKHSGYLSKVHNSGYLRRY